MAFETPHYGIGDLIRWSREGTLQLPDFQRAYKWDDERIRSLLVTVLKGHPMGVLMVLETGGNSVRFKPKPIAGVGPVGTQPDLLMLDGQQRTTSLVQALSGDGVVDTEDDRKKKLRRRYFLDVRKVLGDAREIDESVVSIPEDGRITEDFGRRVVLDVSTRARELKNGLMPLTQAFAPGGAAIWLVEYQQAGAPEALAERAELMRELLDRVFTPVSQYKIPAIKLTKDTSKDAVATVFEKVNTGGLPLNVFELLTATFAGDAAYYAEHGTDFRLAEDWERTVQLRNHHPAVSKLGATDFLQAVTLLASLKRRHADLQAGKAKPSPITARREDVLQLDLREYLDWADPLRSAIPWLAGFLRNEHIHSAGDLPYNTQLVPLLAVKVILGDKADLHAVNARLRQWFWSGVLGELYGSAAEARSARDVEQVPAWAQAAATGEVVNEPDTVSRAGFFEDRLLSLRTRQSAAYKGIYALLMAQDTPCIDWMEAKKIDHATYAALQIDLHHVFPRAWCEKNKIAPELRESIVNKTPLARRTNILLGGMSPAEYTVKRLDKQGSTPEQVDSYIATHAIDPATLRTGDFVTYFNNRKEALLQLIEAAMGKPVARNAPGAASDEAPTNFEPQPEDPETLDNGDAEDEDLGFAVESPDA